MSDSRISFRDARGRVRGTDATPIRTLPGRTWSTVALVVAALTWTAVVVAAAANDVFVTSGPPVATILTVALPVAAFLAVHRSAPSVRALIAHADLAAVLALQTWRVVGAAFLFGWADGTLPAAFAIPAGIGDVATGIVAVPVTLAAARGRLTWHGLAGFTALGVGDFALALATGAALRPAALETLPWALFPTVAVPAFAIVHLVAILAFRAQR